MFIYAKLLVIGLVALLSGASGWYIEHLRFAAFETKVEVQGKLQEAKNKALVESQKSITEGVANDYKDKIAAIKRYYSGRLLNSTKVSELPVISCAASGTNEGTADKVLATQVTQLPEQCAETTQQLLQLQQWILDQKKTIQ